MKRAPFASDAGESNAELMAVFLGTLAPALEMHAAHAKPGLRGLPRYNHIGALIADTVLQSGLSYKSVVQPRVNRILSLFGAITTTSGITTVVRTAGSAYVLQWKHQDKIRRFEDVLRLCARESIETVGQLRDWLTLSSGRERLAAVRGVGPKSVDYTAMLCGLEAVPMDRHLLRLVNLSGVETASYFEAQAAFVAGCAKAGLDVSETERATWNLMRACT